LSDVEAREEMRPPIFHLEVMEKPTMPLAVSARGLKQVSTKQVEDFCEFRRQVKTDEQEEKEA